MQNATDVSHSVHVSSCQGAPATDDVPAAAAPVRGALRQRIRGAATPVVAPSTAHFDQHAAASSGTSVGAAAVAAAETEAELDDGDDGSFDGIEDLTAPDMEEDTTEGDRKRGAVVSQQPKDTHTLVMTHA